MEPKEAVGGALVGDHGPADAYCPLKNGSHQLPCLCGTHTWLVAICRRRYVHNHIFSCAEGSGEQQLPRLIRYIRTQYRSLAMVMFTGTSTTYKISRGSGAQGLDFSDGKGLVEGFGFRIYWVEGEGLARKVLI